MKKLIFFSTFLFVSVFCFSALGQGTGGTALTITKITKDLITMPQYSYSGGLQIQANQRDLFLQIETEFSATGEPADDVSLKYFVAINGQVLSGEVTHTNILPGKGLRSVMYAPPKVLARLNGGRPITANLIQNVAVQISQGGAVKDEANLTRAAAQWYAALPKAPGVLLNKNETPFASLYWDRYEQIKPSGH